MTDGMTEDAATRASDELHRLWTEHPPCRQPELCSQCKTIARNLVGSALEHLQRAIAADATSPDWEPLTQAASVLADRASAYGFEEPRGEDDDLVVVVRG